MVALGFMVLLALINLRGVGESVKFNVVLTLVELAALAIVIAIGFWVMATQGADLGQIVVFDNSSDRGMFAAVTVATAIAFFAMVGFEDSVNMVEETQEPERIFPRVMLTGLGIAVVIYMLVAVSVVMVLPLGDIQSFDGETGILIEVVKVGAPDLPVGRLFPFLTVFAVANTALINMLMASRLIYGMARQDVLPRSLGKVLPGSSYAVDRNHLHHRPRPGPDHLRHHRRGHLHRRGAERHDRPAAALRLHDRQHRVPRRAPQVRHHPRASARPRWTPIVGAVTSAFLVGPWARDPEDWIQYRIAAVLLVIGIVLWAITWFTNRGIRAKKTGFRDVDHLGG